MRNMTNALVNKDRIVQDELSMNYIMLNVTGNTHPKTFKVEILTHNWVFNWWWRGYIAISLSIAIYMHRSGLNAKTPNFEGKEFRFVIE